MESAAQTFRKALEHNPWNAGGWNQLGSALAYLHRYDEAAEAFEAAISLQPDYPAALLNLAKIHMQTPDYDKATQLATVILRMHPGHPGATKLLQDIYHLQNGKPPPQD